MRLYSSPLSPYSARVRVSIYAKQLDLEIIKPSSIGGMKSEAFLAVTPIGKIPALLLDDGTLIAESEAIVEYLEDAFPTPPLLPRNAVDRSRARMVARIADLYVQGALTTLLTMMPVSIHHAPVAINVAVVDKEMPKLEWGLNQLEHFLSDSGPLAAGESLTVADGAIPYLCFTQETAKHFSRPDLISARPKITRYLQAIRQHPVAWRVHEEVMNALAERKNEVRAKFSVHAEQP